MIDINQMLEKVKPYVLGWILSTLTNATVSMGAHTQIRLLTYDGGAGQPKSGLGIDMIAGPREFSVFSASSSGTDGFFTLILRTESTGALAEIARFSYHGMRVPGLPVYANNAAAIAGGLAAGAFYRSGGDPDHLCICH